MSKLFPRIPYFTDETPISWASRQAAFHTGGCVWSFLSDLGVPAWDLTRGVPVAVERLCIVAGQDSEIVLSNAIIVLAKRQYSLRGNAFSAEFTTGAVTRYCPLCLQEDAKDGENSAVHRRHRTLWRLAPYRTCPKHKLPLSSSSAGLWNDKLHELQKMASQISEQAVLAGDRNRREPSPLQNYVAARLEGVPGPEWLDRQGIEQACRAAEMFGVLLKFGANQMAADMTDDMRDAAERAAWPVLQQGPNAVREVLAEHLKRSGTKRGQPSPRLAFGMLYRWLSASRSSKEHGPIRDIVRQTIIEHVALNPGQMLLGEAVKTPRFSSMSSIAKAAGIHRTTLEGLLRDAVGLTTESHADDSAEPVLVDYENAMSLLRNTDHAVPVTKVPELLNASRPLVTALIDLGYLTRVQTEGQIRSKIGKSIDGRSIQKMLEKLSGLGEVVEDPPSAFVNLAKAAEKSRVSMRVILQMVLGPQLLEVRRLGGEKGFTSILVSPAEITELVYRLRRKARGGECISATASAL